MCLIALGNEGDWARNSPEPVQSHMRHVRWSSDYGYCLQTAGGCRLDQLALVACAIGHYEASKSNPGALRPKARPSRENQSEVEHNLERHVAADQRERKQLHCGDDVRD